MRIQIGHHTNTRHQRMKHEHYLNEKSDRWMVYPRSEKSGVELEEGSPCLEVHMNGCVGEKVDRILFRVGDAYLVVTDEEFEQMITDHEEHDFDEAASRGDIEEHLLEKLHVWPEKVARHYVNLSTYEEMEKQWNAVKAFVDFEYTL